MQLQLFNQARPGDTLLCTSNFHLIHKVKICVTKEFNTGNNPNYKFCESRVLLTEKSYINKVSAAVNVYNGRGK